MALRWVGENIERFGGDARNITVFGESAGAMSIGTLLGLPAARGLFHKAIAQSGGAHTGHTRSHSAKVAQRLLTQLGVTDPASLAGMPHTAILKAQSEMLTEPHDLGGLAFAPTIDGSFLPARPIEQIRAGSARDVAVMTGTTRDEWNLFTATRAKLRLMDGEKLLRYTKALVGEANAGALLDAYREGSPFERWNAVMTDHSFMVPATRLLEAQGAYAPVFSYRFDWSSSLLGGLLGACHALELGFVFGTYNAKLSAAFFGTGARADALSLAMMQSWIAFARSGAPGADWPRYDTLRRRTMIFGDGAPHVFDAPNEVRRKAWEAIPDAMVGP
jgi:para-nitrobenzyl esterase